MWISLNLVFTADHKVFYPPDLSDSKVDLLMWRVLEDGLQVDLVQLLHISQHPGFHCFHGQARPGGLYEQKLMFQIDIY